MKAPTLMAVAGIAELEFRIHPFPAKSLQTFGSSPNDKERYTWIVPSRCHGECLGAGARPARSARQLSLESSRRYPEKCQRSFLRMRSAALVIADLAPRSVSSLSATYFSFPPAIRRREAG